MMGSDDFHGMVDQATLVWIQPLILSFLAGLSTCLGAACVFCVNSKDRRKDQPVLSHGLMAFSLSLAGSVMVTVSFASILPESFQDETAGEDVGFHMIPIQSFLFVQRCLGFGIGCLLYVLLSKFAFPEPDAVLQLDETETEDLVVDSSSEDVTYSKLSRVEEESLSLDPPPFLRRGTSSSVSLDGVSSQCNNNNIRSEPARPLVKRQVASSPGCKRPLASTTTTDATNKRENSETFIDDKTDRRFGLLSWTTGTDLQTNSARRAWRVTMLLFISLAVHNFPEGLAVAASTMHSVHLGVTTTIAIALHNIPEGIAIAIPCIAARPDSPFLAFGLASLSGLFEPLGALVALFVLKISASLSNTNDVSALSMNNVLAFVAGVMTTVAFVELFPEAWRHSSKSYMPFGSGLLAGVVVMLGSDYYLD